MHNVPWTLEVALFGYKKIICHVSIVNGFVMLGFKTGCFILVVFGGFMCALACDCMLFFVRLFELFCLFVGLFCLMFSFSFLFFTQHVKDNFIYFSQLSIRNVRTSRDIYNWFVFSCFNIIFLASIRPDKIHGSDKYFLYHH